MHLDHFEKGYQVSYGREREHTTIHIVAKRGGGGRGSHNNLFKEFQEFTAHARNTIDHTGRNKDTVQGLKKRIWEE